MKLTLKQFIEDFSQHPLNQWVKHPGFIEIYVRKSPELWLDQDIILPNVLTIANIAARQPGKGAFTKLIEFLTNKKINIHVENVLERYFAEKLLRLGFKKIWREYNINHEFPVSFYKEWSSK